MNPIKIAPSILAADFSRLGAQVQEAEKAGADWIHFDVMDGRFVPNISIGLPVLSSLKRVTTLPLDVHLMIVEPERYLADFARAGADVLTVHVEACPHLHRTVQQIHELGVKAGVALNPATPISAVEEILPDLDLVLVMTVNPGFGGQKFIPATLSKLRRLRGMIDALEADIELEVDGGINARTIGEAAAAGASVVVAGSAIFGAPAGIAAALDELRIQATKKPELSIAVPAG